MLWESQSGHSKTKTKMLTRDKRSNQCTNALATLRKTNARQH